MTDIKAPLYSRATGQTVEIVDIEPVVRYQVKREDGITTWLTQAEFDEKVTNEAPKFIFDHYDSRAGVRFRALPNYDFVRINTSNRQGFGRSQHDLDVDSVRKLHARLGRWLDDRQPPAVVNECGGAPMVSAFASATREYPP